MHADCEEVLLEQEECLQENIWGAAWYPESQEVTFDSFINLRPRQGNRSMELEDQTLRDQVEAIVREIFAS
jgi:hypothetical protein